MKTNDNRTVRYDSPEVTVLAIETASVLCVSSILLLESTIDELDNLDKVEFDFNWQF